MILQTTSGLRELTLSEQMLLQSLVGSGGRVPYSLKELTSAPSEHQLVWAVRRLNSSLDCEIELETTTRTTRLIGDFVGHFDEMVRTSPSKPPTNPRWRSDFCHRLIATVILSLRDVLPQNFSDASDEEADHEDEDSSDDICGDLRSEMAATSKKSLRSWLCDTVGDAKLDFVRHAAART